MSAPSEYYDWNGVYPVEEVKAAPWPAPAIDPREEKSAVPVDGDKDRALMRAALEEHRWSLDYGPIPYRDSASPEMARHLGIKGWKVWEEVSTLNHLRQVNAAAVPAYQSANYGEDQRVKLGVFIKQRNVKAPMKRVLGPANHCQWSSEYKAVKDNPFNITIELLRWYDYWLKGVDNGITREPGITYYTYNAPPGREWSQAWQWPIPTARPTRHYFAAGLGLSLSAPMGQGAMITGSIIRSTGTVGWKRAFW
jgi:predicted acyl esterase